MTVLMTILALLAQDPPGAASEGSPVDEIIVIGQAARPDPFDLFRALCLDANRLDGHAFRPDIIPKWSALPPNSPWASGDPRDASFLRREGELSMILRISEHPDTQLDRVQRNVCSLTLVGPHDQTALERGMSRSMGGAGTGQHLTYEEAYPTFPGWTQLAWAAIPGRAEREWRVYRSGRGQGEPGFVVVTDPTFYARARYVVTELRYTVQDGQPISHIALTYLFRDEGPPR